MKMLLGLSICLLISPAILSAGTFDHCTQLERSIGLPAVDCGKYNVVELGALKGKQDLNDGKYVTPPRFILYLGKNNR